MCWFFSVLKMSRASSCPRGLHARGIMWWAAGDVLWHVIARGCHAQTMIGAAHARKCSARGAHHAWRA
jgi:hypothetical protein